jgi:hypothetical protein|tara:strand:- start:1751 stop:2095 length:345 start_codon:yes stop_codon:yes gene_type:complete
MRRRASSCGVETTDAADSRDATRRRDARRDATLDATRDARRSRARRRRTRASSAARVAIERARAAREIRTRGWIASVRHRATRAATRDARRGEGRRDVGTSTEANDGGRRVDTR